jgi:hypothetical protein
MVRSNLAFAVVLVLPGLVAADDLKSGPQAGDRVPGPFHPLNINGLYAGKKACLYCIAGERPTVAIFARDPNNAVLRKLIAAVEDAAARHAKAELNAFVVICSDSDKLAANLEDLADKSNLQHVLLAIDAKEGPEKYSISMEAEITVLLYRERTVMSNFAFAKDKLTAKDGEKVIAEIARLVK